MAEPKTITGLTCPNCGGVLSIPEGARIVACPFCEMRHLVAGDRGVPRYGVTRQIDRNAAGLAVQGFWSGMNKAMDLSRTARIQELFVAYLPYWRVRAHLVGWIFGRRRQSKNSTRPVEVQVAEDVNWNDAACEVTEFGVESVPVRDADLGIYNSDAMRADGMVFEPTESRTDALDQARTHFVEVGRSRGKMSRRLFDRFQFVSEQLSIVYYPLWVGRYLYKGRTYQVVVDGHRGGVLYGKAPGNILYRSIMLVIGMALGNLVLVNGTLLAINVLGNSKRNSDASCWLPLAAVAAGASLIAWGYRTFRYGEEVEVGAPHKESEGMLDSAQKALDVFSKFTD